MTPITARMTPLQTIAPIDDGYRNSVNLAVITAGTLCQQQINYRYADKQYITLLTHTLVVLERSDFNTHHVITHRCYPIVFI